MDKRSALLPALRLVLNYECNGKCYFCHHEGNSRKGKMPFEMVQECASAAVGLGIPGISLTGGEPTLREDLPEIIESIQRENHLKITLTSNGVRLAGVSEKLSQPIEVLNLSIISRHSDIAKQYQNVDPMEAIQHMKHFPARFKNLNIVVTQDNISEIEDLVAWCRRESISLVLMTLQGQENTCTDTIRRIATNLARAYHGRITMRPNCVFEICFGENHFMRIKTPFFSSLIQHEACEKCEEREKCFEKMCAIRVFPDGEVSPCLSRKILFSQGSIADRINDAYNFVEQGMFLERDIFR